MSINIMFVCETLDLAWATVLSKALLSLGKMDNVSPSSVSDQLLSKDYQLIILDAASVEDLSILVAQLHRCLPKIPIVVVTSSPTWQLARKVFLAGASDYIRKSLNEKVLLTTFREILMKTQTLD